MIKILICLMLLTGNLLVAQVNSLNRNEKLQQLKNRNEIKVPEVEKDILRIEYPGGKVMYKNICDYKHPESSKLYRWNDVELFDLNSDPTEMTNLATQREDNADLILAMSEKLESAIKREIGVDDGREMPQVEGVDWGIDRIDL